MKSVAQTVIEADRFYTIAAHTGNVIQAVEGSKDGGTVRLGKYDHKPEQEWSFVREGDGVYRIRNRASGKLLDLTMTGTANGTWLHLWEDVGGTSQMWKVEHTPEGTVRLRSSWAGGKCVDTVGIGAEVGAVLQIWQEVPGGGDQLWVISEVKDRVKRAAKVEQAAPAAETKAAPDKEAAPVKKPAARKPRTAKKVEEKPAAKKAAKAKAEPAAPAVEVKAAPAVATKAEPVTKAEPAAKAAPAAEAKTAPAAAKPKAKRAPCKKTVKK
ncbi:MAG: RICIN domain-containing protein [Faecalibacterium prausnitzii]